MMMVEKIIEYIKVNRVSTTEIADCLGKKGNIPNVKAVNQGLHKVGKVRYVYGFAESNWMVFDSGANFANSCKSSSISSIG